jgi:long-chain acyl-CoA synthetase
VATDLERPSAEDMGLSSPSGFNLATILRESTRRVPDKVVARFAAGSLTYAELDRQSDTLAAALQLRGIEPGDAVALQLPNVPEFLVAYFGILKAGAVAVPLNVLLKERELDFHLRDSQASVLVTWAGLDRAALGLPTFVAGGEADNDAEPFDTLLTAPVPGETPLVPRRPDDTAVVIYTSGTTGKPKGAELTHFQLYMNCDIPARQVDFTGEEVVIAALPLFHVFGLSSILHPVVRFGASLTLIPRFDAETVLTAIERDRATFFDGVPTMFIALLANPLLDQYDLSSLRVAISGGASIAAEVLDEWERRVGVTILEGYGLSETGSTATVNRSAADRRVYSVGKPVWGVELEIWDDAGTRLPPGHDHVGEIVVRGFNVMKGYLNDPAATADVFAGGWLHTGDLGYVDEDGFVFIVDRKKELIIRGGYNVYPREVEEVLYSHPAVAEAAVVGVADPRLGEEVKAVVALRSGEDVSPDAIVAFAKERLAAYKYPRLVDICDELPKGPSGKILKTELKA